MLVIGKIKGLVASVLWKVSPVIMAKRMYTKMKKGESIIVHGNNDFYSNIQENFNFFLSDEQRTDHILEKNLILDIIKCYYKYGTEVNEYFSYDFANKPHDLRKQYLSRREKDVYLSHYYGKDCEGRLMVLKDKYTFYSIAKNFYKREAILLESENDLPAFIEFIQKHPFSFAKLIKGRGGKGAKLVESLDVYSEGVKEYLIELLSEGGVWILEEKVEQDDRMAYWNKSSINTVRISSFITSDGPVCFYPFMRFGKTGSIVDNASSGGYFVAIDGGTGCVVTDAFDKRGHRYERHPEHGDIIKGHIIPEWKELLNEAKELHQSLFPEHKYIGFDFALTPKGWVVIEANWGHFAPLQVAIERGIKEDFIKIMNS